MKKLLVLVLMAMVLLGSFSSAYGVAATLQLEVEKGGVAVYDGDDYGEGTHDLGVPTGTAIDVDQYSNAGYENDGIDKSDTVYTVKFKSKDNVYGLPFYSIDGTFSGFDGDGSDISDHNPRGDVLAAAMTASTDEANYKFGDTVQISLEAEVTDGDDNTDTLKEVDLYKDGNLVEGLGEISTFISIDTYTMPSTEAELFDDGFTLDDGVYTKTIKYELVDRYNEDGGSAIVASAEVDIVKEGNATIFVTGDDEYTIYLNGQYLGKGDDANQWTKLDKYREFIDKDDYLIAVKGEDTAGNIAGITVTVKFDDGTEHISDNASGWVRALVEYDDWYKVNYEANEDEWVSVTDINGNDRDGNWIKTNPATSADPQWIWSDTYKEPMDKVVYFRSVEPELKPENYTLTINYQYEDGTEAAPSHTEILEENTAYSVDSPDIDGYTPDQAVVSGIITEDTNVTVTYSEDANATIYITADDAYELYFDGEKIGEGLETDQWNHLDKYRVNIENKNDYLLAVKAWDLHDVISGMTLTVKFDDGDEHVANNTSGWGRALEEYTNWNQPDYEANGDEWLPVNDITNPNENWVQTNSETEVEPQWIWSNTSGNFEESPVWFRSVMPESQPDPQPAMTITKTVDNNSVYLGDEVTYTITVTNTGDVDLDYVHVSDDQLGYNETVNIAVGESFTHTLTTSYETTGSKVNTARAEYGIDTNDHMMKEDTATVRVREEEVPEVPAMTITKTVDNNSVYVGDDVTYTITVTNTGDVALDNVYVSDEALDYGETVNIAVGGSFTHTLTTSYETTGSKVNTARAEYGIDTNDYMMEEDSIEVDVSRRSTPSRNTYRMTIDKEAEVDEVEVGDTVDFTIVVKNTGNTTLTNIEVVDDMTGLNETITLSPGESETFNVSVTAEEVGTLTNTAEASHSRASFVKDSDSVRVVDGEEEIDEEEIPEGTPDTDEEPQDNEENEEEQDSQEEDATQDEIVEIDEEQTPLELPDTGVLPLELLYGLGALVSGAGLIIFKKKK